MQLKTQVQNLLTELNKGVLEKEKAISLSLLSAMAGESIFLLGAPGVAKSLIARRLKFAFKDAQSFEYLMNRFSTPDEIFGPISISKLKNEDKYERIVENYLPSAQIVFLDEIWKAGPSIQNALLTVLNEKVYRNGTTEIKIPMKALIAASNELPAKDSGLEALWDRFLVRLEVKSVENVQNFNDLLTKTLKSYEDNVSTELKITEEQFTEIQTAIDEIEVPENVLNVIHTIRQYIQAHNQQGNNKENQLYVSDRRWRKIVRLLRTSALLNDRNAVDLMDCFLIQYCLWNELEQCDIIKQFIKDTIQKYGYKLSINLNIIANEIKHLEADAEKETSFIKKEKVNSKKVYNIANKNYYRILNLTNFFSYETNDLIDKVVIDTLKPGYTQTIRYRHDMGDKDTVFIAKGRNDNELILSGSQNGGNYFPFETNPNADKEIKLSKLPHPVVKAEWDKKVISILAKTSELKTGIQNYQNNELHSLKTNLFVLPALANIVESNLRETFKAIEKLEIDVNKVKYYYDNVIDQSNL